MKQNTQLTCITGRKEKRTMNTKTKLILSGLGIAALTTLVVKPVDAFVPLDWIKSKLTPAQQTQMATYHNQRNEALAKFLGKPISQIQQELASGKRPRDLMNADQLAQWQASRQTIKAQHQQEFGVSQYGYGQGRGHGRGFGRTDSN